MSLRPDQLDFEIWKGATFRSVLWLYTDEAGEVPRDLTGHSALLEIKNQAGDVTPLLTLSTENGGIVLGGTTGQITLLIPAAGTAAVAWKRGVYDLTITAGLGGDTDVLLYGSFKVRGV